MQPDHYKELMREKLDRELFDHSLGVADAAAELAERYGADKEKAYLSGIVHDYGKIFTGHELMKLAGQMKITLDRITRREFRLLHAPVGAALIKKELNISDPEILLAVANHTTGRPGMGCLEKVVYLADYIERGRDFPIVHKIRQAAREDLDLALLEAVEFTIRSVLDRRLMLHPRSVALRNEMLQKQREKTGIFPANRNNCYNSD